MSDDAAEPPTGEPEDAPGAGRAPEDPQADAAPTHDAAPLAAPDREPQPEPPSYKPNYAFLAGVSIVSLTLDLLTKWWATSRLSEGDTWAERHVEIIAGHLALIFARNKGGAWGLLQDENEMIRRPFFVLISLGAIVFIVSLYRRLTPKQTALKWGLPLVLGGALGNLVDRIRYGHVVDFIDVRAKWIGWINELAGSHTEHWPTFNVADIAICAGVLLMAVDMFQTRKPKRAPAAPSAPLPAPDAQAAAPSPVETHEGS